MKQDQMNIFMGILVKLKGEKSNMFSWKFPFLNEKKNKSGTKLGHVYINMEMKAIIRALSPPHDQPHFATLSSAS